MQNIAIHQIEKGIALIKVVTPPLSFAIAPDNVAENEVVAMIKSKVNRDRLFHPKPSEELKENRSGVALINALKIQTPYALNAIKAAIFLSILRNKYGVRSTQLTYFVKCVDLTPFSRMLKRKEVFSIDRFLNKQIIQTGRA